VPIRPAAPVMAMLRGMVCEPAVRRTAAN